jgi:hypothetical protein
MARFSLRLFLVSPALMGFLTPAAFLIRPQLLTRLSPLPLGGTSRRFVP